MGVSKQLSFTLTNHSSSDPVRFTWSPPPEVTFSPCTGHLQPNCAKDVTVTFCSNEPKTYSATNIPCKVTKIKLGEAQDKVRLKIEKNGLYGKTCKLSKCHFRLFVEGRIRHKFRWSHLILWKDSWLCLRQNKIKNKRERKMMVLLFDNASFKMFYDDQTIL